MRSGRGEGTDVNLWSPTGKARGTSIKCFPTPKASEGYPPVAKSAEAQVYWRMNDLLTTYAFIHGQSPWPSA